MYNNNKKYILAFKGLICKCFMYDCIAFLTIKFDKNMSKYFKKIFEHNYYFKIEYYDNENKSL